MKAMRKVLICLISVLFVVGVALAAQININTADVKTLMTIKGIGHKKAESIVNYRKTNGSFKTIQDLTKVKGIGPKIFKKIKGEITIGNMTTNAVREAPKMKRSSSKVPKGCK